MPNKIVTKKRSFNAIVRSTQEGHANMRETLLGCATDYADVIANYPERVTEFENKFECARGFWNSLTSLHNGEIDYRVISNYTTLGEKKVKLLSKLTPTQQTELLDSDIEVCVDTDGNTRSYDAFNMPIDNMRRLCAGDTGYMNDVKTQKAILTTEIDQYIVKTIKNNKAKSVAPQSKYTYKKGVLKLKKGVVELDATELRILFTKLLPDFGTVTAK